MRLYFLIFLLPKSLAFVTTTSSSDDLVSARCQSKCLFDLEQRHKNNTETRRLLRHHITNICKEDDKCSSCILPCREMYFQTQDCLKSVCKETKNLSFCQESCAFMEKISQQKPGSCTRKMSISNLECTAICDRDSDCPEIDKCCTVGCSRVCLGPVLHDQRLLPIPEGITIQERKRKRSAIVRWVMKRMSPQHISTSSNLFVIQWRWSVHKNEKTMIPWQTIMVRNKMYAILKHVLAVGRYYSFRIAAVNLHGSYGFSNASRQIFKLSKEAKAPSAPLNLTLKSMQYCLDTKTWLAKITWIAPESDLPLKDYQLSWWKTTREFFNLYQERRLRYRKIRNAKISENNLNENISEIDYDLFLGEIDGVESDLSEHFKNRQIKIVPSYSTKAELKELEQNQIYIIELLATVELSDIDLYGKPAVLFIITNYTAPEIFSTNILSNTATVKMNLTKSVPDLEIYQINQSELNENNIFGNSDWIPIEENTINLKTKNLSKHETPQKSFRVTIKTPYFENSRLKTDISWNDHFLCKNNQISSLKNNMFQIYVRSLRCINALPPQKFEINDCVATIENLQFECDYFVEIKSIANEQIIAQQTFSTLPCNQTSSKKPLHCIPFDTTTETNLLFTTPKLINKNSTEIIKNVKISGVGCISEEFNKAECFWNDMSDATTKSNPIIGYRTIIVSDSEKTRNISIVKANERHILLNGLKSHIEYIFKVQAITTHGIGTIELLHKFYTKQNVSINKEIEMINSEIHFELPLESNNSFKNSDLFKLLLRFITSLIFLSVVF